VPNIKNDRSPAFPVFQHFLSWGKYETLVQNAAKKPISVVVSMAEMNVLTLGQFLARCRAPARTNPGCMIRCAASHSGSPSVPKRLWAIPLGDVFAVGQRAQIYGRYCYPNRYPAPFLTGSVERENHEII
jgi:hypothetical protein